MDTKVIAEIANSHQGEVDNLFKLIDIVSKSDAQAIKFQWFKYDHLATPDYKYYEDYKKLYITQSDWDKIIKYADEHSLEIWVDVFDEWGLELLKKHQDKIYGVKLHSTIIQSEFMINNILDLNKPLIIGIGGWHDKEIKNIINKISKNNNDITLMHGFQGYPTEITDANLKRIKCLKDNYDFPIGFADHTDASIDLAKEIPVYAYFAGAKVIEKHLILERKKEFYDYYSSLEPDEFETMIAKLKEAEKINGTCKINKAERQYLDASLKAVASRDIEKGEIISFDKVDFKRTSSSSAFSIQELNKALPLVSNDFIKSNSSIDKESTYTPNITIAVVCRLKSTRLPKKAIKPINGVASVERVLLNTLEVKNTETVLATSTMKEDKPLENYNLDGKVDVVKGDPDNVIKRLLKVAEEKESDIIVRVTGDCPSVSPKALEFLINSHLNSGADFTMAKQNFPVGLLGDIYNVNALKRLLEEHEYLEYTEYLLFYFKNNPDYFNVNIVELPEEYQYPEWRLTLDEPKDLEMFEELYSGMGAKERAVSFFEIKDYIKSNPDVIKINENVGLKWRDVKEKVDKINEATTF